MQRYKIIRTRIIQLRIIYYFLREILRNYSVKSTELLAHVHRLHAKVVTQVCMQLTNLRHSLNLYADVLSDMCARQR